MGRLSILKSILSNRAGAETSNSGCTTIPPVPTRCPVLFLTGVAAVPGGLALRANLEVLPKADNLAPVVAAILSPIQRISAKPVEFGDWVKPPPPQPMDNAGQNIPGDVVALHDPSRHGFPCGLRYVPNPVGVRQV